MRRVALALTGARLRAPSTIQRIQPWVTGTVWKIECRPGASVAKGQTILIVESMKMGIPLDAPAAGRLDGVLAAEGEIVSEGQVLALVLKLK